MGRMSHSFKPDILREYCAGNRRHSFSSFASRYGVRGGARTIQRWYAHWDGTPQSLNRIGNAGRKALLTPRQVEQYIIKPVRRASQHHVAIYYSELMDTIHDKTPVDVSLRAVQRYGKKKEGIRGTRTQKRPETECKILQQLLFTCALSYACTHLIL